MKRLTQFESSQIMTNKTCVECRRRKIRCNGTMPCDKCTYYEINVCQYLSRKKRKGTARRKEPDPSLSPAEIVLSRLFPSSSAELLAKLSRAQLIQLAQTHPPRKSSENGSTYNTPADDYSDSDEERGWNESKDLQHPELAVCDDVNNLSLSVAPRSYTGISSLHAIFRIIFRLRPHLNYYLEYDRGAQHHMDHTYFTAQTTTSLLDDQLLNVTPSVSEEISIDAYFASVHGIVPFLDESDFRQTWRSGQRQDRPWLALLNMVLTLGSLAASDSDVSSRIYFARSKGYLDFDLLGIGCVESLQALCLYGGLYLHYRNSPNKAYAIMGLAYRMGISMGLHRESAKFPSVADAQKGVCRPGFQRQLWWTLFCLDTWGSTSLGRPTLGRWDQETMSVIPFDDMEKMDIFVCFLDYTRAFSHISNRVQDRFAQLLPITIGEIAAFDSEVQKWYESLPHEFRKPEKCPARLASAQHVMRHRYFHLRILLYRPVLLRYAEQKISFESLSLEERKAIGVCRQISCDAIDKVASTGQTVDKIQIWSDVWYLYQASMVLLLSILVDPEHIDNINWRASVERAIQFFDHAIPWSVAASRSKQVVKSMLDDFSAPNSLVSDGSLEFMQEGSPSSKFWNGLGLDMFTEDWWTWNTSMSNGTY